MSKSNKINFIITGALIAAAYAGLTYLSNVFGLAYGPIQLRVSEIFTVLPVFTPAAIPGITLGCFIANIGSFNMLDMFFGTFATLIAAIITYTVRGIKFKGIPFLSFFAPVLINALIIGAEIALFFLPEGATLWGFVISALQVGVGELIVCMVFGTVFYLMVKKYKIFDREMSFKPNKR